MFLFIFVRCYQKDELTKMYAESRIPPSMFQPRVKWVGSLLNSACMSHADAIVKLVIAT